MMLEEQGICRLLHKKEFSHHPLENILTCIHPCGNYIRYYNIQSLSICVVCVGFFDFILRPVHIIQGEEQVPGPIRTKGMFLSDHKDVCSLFG